MNPDGGTYTKVPNFVFDSMGKMAEAELRVVLCLVRLTCGYHRSSVDCSLSAFQKMTGLSRQGCINGINTAMKRGVINRTEGRRGGFVYELVNEVDQSTSQPSGLDNEMDPPTSPLSRPALVNEVDQTSQLSGLELVNEVDRNTPVLKKEKETYKERGRVGSSSKKEKAAPKLDSTQQLAFELLVDSEIGMVHRVATELARALPVVDIYRVVDKWMPDHLDRNVGTGALVSRLKSFVENPRSVNIPTPVLSAAFRNSDLFQRHCLPDELNPDGRKKYNSLPPQAPRKKYSV